MARVSFFFFFFFFFFFVISLPFFASVVSSEGSPIPESGVVQETCKHTSYYDFCVTSLSSDPKSATADVKGLAVIAVNLCSASAAHTSAFAASLAEATSGEDLHQALHGCADKYGQASKALQWTCGTVSNGYFDFAFKDVKDAVRQYPKGCSELFQKRGLQAEFPPEMEQRANELKQRCAIASQILPLLGPVK